MFWWYVGRLLYRNQASKWLSTSHSLNDTLPTCTCCAAPNTISCKDTIHSLNLNLVQWFQVIKIVTVSRQPRVVARFEQHGTKKLISIPITFSDSMCVIKNGKGRNTIVDIYVLDLTKAEVWSSVAMLNTFKRMCHDNLGLREFRVILGHPSYLMRKQRLIATGSWVMIFVIMYMLILCYT